MADMTDQIRGRLTNVFRDVFDDDALEVHSAMSAEDVDGWDSLMHVRLMLSVERTFAVRFTASEIGKLKTVGDLIELIARKTT